MDNNQLLKKLKDELVNYNRNKSTVNTYLTIARSFLKSLKNKEFTDSDAISYLARLREQGKADNTIRFTHYALRKLFVANKIEFSKGPPPIKELDRPYFTKEEIQRLIKNAKIFCDEQQKAFLVMSTIYALRRSEIIMIRPEDIDKKNHAIFIHTEKGGIERKQFIPENIRKYIYNYNWDYELSKATMSVLFYIILDKCKFKLEDIAEHSGWHSIRRSVVTYLMQANVSPISLSHFMRWKSQITIPGASPMINIYNRSSYEEADNEIFKQHPFLYNW